MTDAILSRRNLMTLGCSAAAWPLLSTVTLAQAPWNTRLVVIILRGGMDGLDVVRPAGDRAFAALRSAEWREGPELDGLFRLNPGLSELMPLWNGGDLAFAHAVSSPYRDKRSHFDGQDILEAGTGMDVPIGAVRDGWLNRMLQQTPGVESETAFAIGRESLRILSGPADVASWAPEVRLDLGEQMQLLLELIYEGDPLFHEAAADAVRLAAEIDAGEAASRRAPGLPDRALARFAADRLRGDTRVAAFSIGGWDTHRNQRPAMDRMLKRLADTILTLKQDLGPVWSDTAVLAMTEFGRTARVNGTGGTDHGTGGALVMAGGAIRGGQVHGRWPGVDEASLYDRRDLMPTADVRSYAAWSIRHLTGMARSDLTSRVFPGLDLGDDPGHMI